MTTKKKKITKREPKVREQEKELTDGDFWCFHEFKMKPFPVWRIEAMIKDLSVWLDTADITKAEGIRMSQFFDRQKVTEKDYYSWVEKYPLLKEAHERAMAKIAERRESAALLGTFNPNVVMRYMPIYDRHVVKMMEWQAQLAKTEDQKGMNLTVVLPKAEETDMVPPKKKVE